MKSERIHRSVSSDGVRIVGRVDGQGPPLVLVHGAVADGESEFAELVPLLTDRFTCYRPNMRGRGPSDAHPDVSRRARVRDVAAFIDSIGGPVGLLGVSGGGMLALGAAALTDNVAALVANEPVVFEVMDEETRRGFTDCIDRMEEAAKAGRPQQAAQIFLEWASNEEERAAFAGDPDALEEAAAHMETDLAEFREVLAGEGPSPTAPAVLERITSPTLLVYGSRSGSPWFEQSTRHAARHVPNARLREIAGGGHLSHLIHPQRFADAIVPFLDAELGTGRAAASP